MENVNIYCLGGFTISDDNEAPLVGFRSAKARALLCYLAVTGKMHTRSALAGLLWADLPEENARANLRKTLSNLRQIAGPHLLITRSEAGINPSQPPWLDVRLLISAEVKEADVETLADAISLYKGDFLHGFDVRDAPEFESWSLTQRARFRELALGILDRLIAYFTEETDFNTAISYAKQLLTIEPWREETHRQLIALLAQSGQRTAALAQCESCRRLLREELDIDPTEETRALCEAVRLDRLDNFLLSSHYPTTVTIPSIKRANPNNLPAQSTPFVGRSDELARLSDLLQDPNVRLVTILGAGGMGKTRLALMAAEKQLTHFEDGVYFVALAPLQESETLIPMISQAVGISFRGSEELAEQLYNYLSEKRILLVLDNFEHLLESTGLLSDLIRAVPNLKLLVTSRAKLSLQSEYLFHINGLAYPIEDDRYIQDIEQAAASFDAVDLFLHGAKRSRPDYAWRDQDLPYILEICRLTQGMPLGLLLASSWMELLTPEEIVAELKCSLDFLEADLCDVPARHQSIRAVFESAWTHLSEGEKQVFASLSIFRGGFSKDAAREVACAELPDLLRLADQSLLNREDDGRFALHELLRQYAADRLAASSENHHAVLERHSTHYCKVLKDSEKQWQHGEEATAFTAIKCDFENIRAAWRWAGQHCHFDLLDLAMESFGEACAWLARYRDGEKEFALAVESLQTLSLSTQSFPAQAGLTLARLLIWQGEFCREFLGQHERALILFQQSSNLLQEVAEAGIDSRRAEAQLYIQLARVARDRADQQESDHYWQMSLQRYEELGDNVGVAYMSGGFGWDAYRRDDYEMARHWFEKVLGMWRKLGNTMYRTNTLAGLGTVALAQGRFAESELFLREGLTLDQSRGLSDKLVNLYSMLGNTLKFRGRFEEARQVLEEGFEQFKETGRIEAAIIVQEGLAENSLHLGLTKEARQLIENVHTYWTEHNNKLNMIQSNILLAEIAFAEQDVARAQKLSLTCLEGAEVFGGKRVPLARTLALLALAYFILGDTSRALHNLTGSLRETCDRRSLPLLLRSLPVAVSILCHIGGVRTANDTIPLLGRYPYVSASFWYQEIVSQSLHLYRGSVETEPLMKNNEVGAAETLWEATSALLAEIDSGIANKP